MSPIDYQCRDCGASFAIGVSSLLTGAHPPGCPVCDSEHVAADWEALARRYSEPADAESATPEIGASAGRRD